MASEHRASTRHRIALQFTLQDGSVVVTRDISEQGVYLLVPAGVVLGHWLSFECTMPDTGLRFSAAGEVVRTEPAANGQTGVAIRWHAPKLVPLH